MRELRSGPPRSAPAKNASPSGACRSTGGCGSPTPNSGSSLQRTADAKVAKERVHIDIETDDVDAEVGRLEALGATRWNLQQERGFTFWVLHDPWQNEFCVLQPEFPALLARQEPRPD